MNPYQTRTRLFKALAHPERLRLLYALRAQEECVCHLTALLKKRQAYVSQQLMVLRNAGLIADRKEGLRVYYRLREPRLLALLNQVNELTGTSEPPPNHTTLAACACPKCDAPAGK